MTDKPQPAQFDWATELSDAEAHVSLSEQEAHEIGARLRSMGAKLKTYEDLGGAADDVQLLRTGYAAARLEIESLNAQLHAAKQSNAVQFWLFTSSIPGSALRASHWQAPAQAAPAAVAGPSRYLHPEKCPVTGRPFFMTLDHPELGDVPTYGGPYDSYTIPAPEGEPTDPWHERELRSERYDHDAGWWVEGGEPIPLRIVHEDVLFKLQEDAEAAAPAAQGDK